MASTPAVIGPATYVVRLSRAGGEDAVPLHASALSWSKAVVPPATLSAQFRTAGLIAEYGTIDIRGYWIEAEHPTAGRWGGVATMPRESDDLVDVTARDFSVLLHKKRTAKDYELTAAPAGSHVYRILADASRMQALWIADTSIQETGAPIPLSVRGEDVLGVLNRLASESDQEWRVTPDRLLEWRRRLGNDLSATVQLVWGRHIVHREYVLDLESVVNDLLVIPSDAAYQRTNALVVEDADAIRALGTRMQDTAVISQAISEGGMRPIAEALLRRLATQGQALTLDIVDEDRCFSWFAEGDTISVWIPPLNLRARFRVMVRALDLSTGKMTISGDVEAVA